MSDKHGIDSHFKIKTLRKSLKYTTIFPWKVQIAFKKYIAFLYLFCFFYSVAAIFCFSTWQENLM